MKLFTLLEGISTEKIIGEHNPDIKILSQDSRDEDLTQGLYFAVSGSQVDGHDFIDDAIIKGSVAVVCEKIPQHINSNITYVVIKNIQKEMGRIAGNFYGHPSRKLKIIAVTGTNGKTSVATFASQALQKLGQKTLLLSTAGNYFNGEEIAINRKASSSTEIIELQKILQEFVDRGAQYCCLEATSHALDQERLSGIDIDVAIFTNLTRDHLDYHGTIEHYANAKKKLFDFLNPESIAVTNYDDDFGRTVVSDTQAKVVGYGGGKEIYDYSFDLQTMNIKGVKVLFNQNLMSLPIIGVFNVYNTLAVYALLSELGFAIKDIQKSLESISGVPGRLQIIPNNKKILALVDYAHTPDALENVLKTLQAIPHNNIITVFGCGGDRDTGKRAPMAVISEKYSDKVIATSDNPRTEDPEKILEDIRHGFTRDTHVIIQDREDAIKYAIQELQPSDILLVAGKGDEDYQIIGTEKQYFDDSKVVQKYLV